MSMPTKVFCYEISYNCLRIWRDSLGDSFLFRAIIFTNFSQEVQEILEEFESDDEVFNITDD